MPEWSDWEAAGFSPNDLEDMARARNTYYGSRHIQHRPKVLADLLREGGELGPDEDYDTVRQALELFRSQGAQQESPWDGIYGYEDDPQEAATMIDPRALASASEETTRRILQEELARRDAEYAAQRVRDEMNFRLNAIAERESLDPTQREVVWAYADHIARDPNAGLASASEAVDRAWKVVGGSREAQVLAEAGEQAASNPAPATVPAETAPAEESDRATSIADAKAKHLAAIAEASG